ncbi:hypothetical protein GO755_26500 [Spirosoma sp. HMF4905]|uniref:YopX protein domain-containing protein n=1 Tax=Spirosoma arboris TaxID=2682092 RepID=A0A7K1SIH1_9BACT|nr:YopX family protein [Spirosoma arboris]MVM33617.1 hypothetical protein [Spirosoma arboris]
MRQLKFRLWHTSEYPVVELRNTMAYQPNLSLDGAYDAHMHGNGVMMEFTGQTDMDGKDVYEGDIIETRHEDKMELKGFGLVYNEIAFRDGCFGLIGEVTSEHACFAQIGEIKDARVVGNIFQNPELVGYMADPEELKRWDDKRFAHIPDVEPVVSGNLTNWFEYEGAFRQLQKADGFIPESIESTDWKSLREDFFNNGESVKYAFQTFFYEE